MYLEETLQEILAELRTLNARFDHVGVAVATASPSAPPAHKVPPQVQAAKAVKPETKAPTVELTYDKDVKPALTKVVMTKGRDALTALLKDFGVENGQQLKPEQFADVLVRIG